VDNATLNRFFSLHFVMPFLILIVVCLHVYFLHDKGSSNPSMLSVGESRSDKFLKTSFYPYFVIKDLVGIQIFLFFFLSTVFFFPNYLGHPDNYIPANPIVTPAHIVPE
jgi:quinol-cytochrome oxidoreductase complex cytochrome b subunit